MNRYANSNFFTFGEREILAISLKTMNNSSNLFALIQEIF